MTWFTPYEVTNIKQKIHQEGYKKSYPNQGQLLLGHLVVKLQPMKFV